MRRERYPIINGARFMMRGVTSKAASSFLHSFFIFYIYFLAD